MPKSWNARFIFCAATVLFLQTVAGVERRGKYGSRLNEDPIFVMLDVNMPLVNGIEVLTEIKADPLLSQIPVVMLTSSRHGPERRRMLPPKSQCIRREAGGLQALR
jgi:CheY-like chemotaxis protein